MTELWYAFLFEVEKCLCKDNLKLEYSTSKFRVMSPFSNHRRFPIYFCNKTNRSRIVKEFAALVRRQLTYPEVPSATGMNCGPSALSTRNPIWYVFSSIVQ